MVGHNNLRHSTHAYGVATQDAIHLVLCRCLEGGALNAHIDAILQADLLLACNLTGQFDERLVIGLVHIWESRTRGEVLSAQRVLWEEVDVVGNHHQVANLEARVHTTGSIADEERLDAQLIHDAYGECHLLHVVSLIVVEAALHGHDVYTTELAEDEGSGMSFYGRDGEVWNLTIWYFELISYF